MPVLSWWPEEFWMRREVSKEELKLALYHEFPHCQIKMEMKVVDFPNYIYFEIWVPLEQKNELQVFLRNFCLMQGFGYERQPRERGPEMPIPPQRNPGQSFFVRGNRTVN
jgi:hypothetical protein